MAVLAVVSAADHVEFIVTWAARFAQAENTELHVLCWTHSPTAQFPLLVEEEQSQENKVLIAQVRNLIDENQTALETGKFPLLVDNIQIRSSMTPDRVTAAISYAGKNEVDLMVAMAGEESDESGRSNRSNPFLRQSPCNTVIFYRPGSSLATSKRILAVTADNSNDLVAASITSKLVSRQNRSAAFVRLEDDPGENAIEVGRRELRQLMKTAGIKRTDRIKHKVFLETADAQFDAYADQHDLVLLSANGNWSIPNLKATTTNPAIAVIKRAPPLRVWGKRYRFNWLRPLSPANYADLIQGLRRDSKISIDFLAMLGAAAAIASLGLLQDSPAVVIGSMLLAPLMTPMIGCGLGIAQANPALGRGAIKSIFVGFLLTLVISMVIGFLTPGQNLTAELEARGYPNILDLLVALFSGAAAAYAIARPNISGAIAGVAISTALVPPLCTVGISLAYSELGNATGATVLFLTNVVAIIVSAAITFRLLGVTSMRATLVQRRWVLRTAAILGLIILVLSFPLQRELEKSVLRGKSQPSNYPLTRSVEDAIVEEVEKIRGLQLVASGRPASIHDGADVVLVLASTYPIDESIADRLTAIVRKEMRDEKVIVEIHCLQNMWHRDDDD